MPGARTHDFLTLITVAAADGIYFTRVPHPNTQMAALFTVAYVFAGYACAGDLDINSREYHRWGPLRFLWWPYRMMVPHRSRISHGLVLGGLIRIAYLAVITTVVFWTGMWAISRLGMHIDPSREVDTGWHSFFGFVHMHPGWSAALLTGFVLAGTTHSIADLISTGIKRRL